MKLTDVMAWAKGLGIRPRDAMKMLQPERPEWATAQSAIYADCSCGDEHMRLILPVPPQFGGQHAAMVREVLEREREPGETWEYWIHHFYPSKLGEHGFGKRGWRYTVGDERFWQHAEEIADTMAGIVRRYSEACYHLMDFGPMDSFNSARENRGKVTRPDAHEIARRAAKVMERTHEGSIESLTSWQDPGALPYIEQ